MTLFFSSACAVCIILAAEAAAIFVLLV